MSPLFSLSCTSRVGRPEEGGRHRRPKCLGPTTVVEAAGMAPPQPIFITPDRHRELSHSEHRRPKAAAGHSRHVGG
jgi:hypothetical protein